MKHWLAIPLAMAMAGAMVPNLARAQAGGSTRGSAVSEVSMLPVLASVAMPMVLLSAGTHYSLAAVNTSAEGTVWLIERASDGARAGLQVSGKLAEAGSFALGTAVAVTAISTGWVLSAAGQAIAFVPNELGRSLMYQERVTP